MVAWDTADEEDVWDVELDFVSPDPDEYEAHPIESDMTVGELMEWRYIRAEREKEQVSLPLSSVLPMFLLSSLLSTSIVSLGKCFLQER